MSTPLTIAPLESRTVPESEANTDCAEAGGRRTTRNDNREADRTIRLIKEHSSLWDIRFRRPMTAFDAARHLQHNSRRMESIVGRSIPARCCASSAAPNEGGRKIAQSASTTTGADRERV
jgi:hypothetical protein